MRIADVVNKLLQLPEPHFLAQTYWELLQRLPSRREVRSWRRRLSRRKVSKLTVVQRLICSQEAKQFMFANQANAMVASAGPTRQVLYHAFRRDGMDFVTELYRELLNRAPDAKGLRRYRGTLKTEGAKWHVFETLVSSSEARQLWRMGSRNVTSSFSEVLQRVFWLDGPRFVVALYRELLGRPPLRAELVRWGRSAFLTDGKEEIFSVVVHSPAFRRAVVRNRRSSTGRTRGRALPTLRSLYRLRGADFVHGLYQELLGRAPEPEGLQLHLRILPQTKKFDLLSGFLLSEEAQIARAAGRRLTPKEAVRDAVRASLRERRTEIPLSAVPSPRGPLTSADCPRLSPRGGDTDLLSIVIPTLNQVDFVQQCVRSIQHTLTGVNYEIIVVDDGSTEEFQQSLRAWAEDSGTKTMFKRVREGFSKTVNAGIREAQGRDILVLNNDVVFHDSHWYEALSGALHAAPNIGIVGARLLYPDGRIQHGGAVPAPNGWFAHRYQLLPGDYAPAQVVEDIAAVTGALVLIRRAVFEDIGLFSEDYAMAFEDIDLCYRAGQAGWRVVYCGAAAAIHAEGGTRGNLDDPEHELYRQREMESMATFHARWEGVHVSPFRHVKVIYVLTSTGVAGGIRVVFEHLNRLADLGYDVALYSLDSAPRWFPLRVPVQTFSNYGQMLVALRAQDALKVATWWETLPVVLDSCDATRGGQGKGFYLVQDVEDSYYPNQVDQQNRVRATYTHSSVHLLTEGEWVRSELFQRSGRSAKNISIGIDQDVYRSSESAQRNTFEVLAVSRASQHLKGFDVTVEGVLRAHRQLPQIHVMTFGIEPPSFPGLPGLPVQYLQLPDDQQVAQLYSSCHVFVQTSNHEGFGLPILEAMACGAPVVTTRADGNEEFCVAGYNCILVEKGDAQGVADGIVKVLTNPEFANYIAENGRKTAAKYSWGKVMFNLNNAFAVAE